ncbi:hypothetical protein BTZ20_3370 [Rhodococcus sp. MTM3W5.2]|nr:hypothetical protein BTZ20_3370 [Rhodococcus sp. MTM3W5.2]
MRCLLGDRLCDRRVGGANAVDRDACPISMSELPSTSTSTPPSASAA